MTAEHKARFQDQLNVSRETISRLDAYEALLRKWNPAINLVSPATLAGVWERHFLDSAQLFSIGALAHGRWVDLGSGGGFPGLVVAILALEKCPELEVLLVESDKRKSAFLSTVARELSLNVTVLAERIEAIPALRANVVSARALAPLDKLLGFANRHLSPDGLAIFPKGAGWRQELATAQESWSFKYQMSPSETESEAAILTITEVSRA